jgi:branched-chain amino acid aminotransferase
MNCSRQSPQIVWLNGSFLPAHEAAILPLDRGFLYGDGLFETIRSENGSILYLHEHLERLRRSMAVLRISVDPTVKWDVILKDLLLENGLLGEVSVVKIIVTRGVCSGLGLPQPSPPTICLTAQKYIPPTSQSYQRGWRLHTFRTGFSPPLSGHKTLNYLYFLTARQAALDADADEALILDSQGKIAEASTGSLLARAEGKWWTPASPHQLPGITLTQVSRLLTEAGQRIESRTAGPADIHSAETVWLLNSLMGIMPVSSIDGIQLSDLAAGEAALLRGQFFERGKVAKRI